MKTTAVQSDNRNGYGGIRRRIFLALGVVAGTLAATPFAGACDACNIAFTEEVMTLRADSPAGRDLQRAIENQSKIRFEGLEAGYLVAARKQAEAEGASGAGVQVASSARLSGQGGTVSLPGGATAARAMAAGVVAQARETGEPLPEYMLNSEFLDIVRRDHEAPLPTTSYVPQDAPADKSFTIRLHEGQAYIGNGVVYDGFLTNGSIPGPTIIVDEGDIVELTIVNEGKVPHGASIHAAYTQTSKYLGKIDPGDTRTLRFKASYPGVFMYHCAPGGHAIPMHVLFGQYGMIVVKPKKEYQLAKDLGKQPDLELYLIQNELYASGRDAIEGEAAYVTFNGKLFRYVEEPIMVKPGDYVRIYFLNIGPNLLSTFHIVGIIWDYVYWQGHPDVCFPGGQSVTAGPTDAWVIEFRIPPDEGAYTMLSHAVGSTSRGAIGLLVAKRDAETPPVVLAEGPQYSAEEMALNVEQAQRIISPFRPGTHPSDEPVVYGPEVKEVVVSIIGNSFSPKVIQVAPGTKVTWVNEDVFTYFAGEYAGIHNAASVTFPEDGEPFVGPLLAHGEKWSHVFEGEDFTYDYICTPHPYMFGRVIVKTPEYTLQEGAVPVTANLSRWVTPMLALSLILASIAFVRARG